MPTEVKRTLDITYNNAGQYMTADKCTIVVSSLGVQMAIRLYMNGSTDGYATLKDNAKSKLYPTSAAHPFKLDLDAVSGVQLSNDDCYVALEFGGVSVKEIHPSIEGKTSFSYTGMTALNITNSTMSTNIRWHLHSNNRVNAVTVNSFTLVMYFHQYACSANVAGGGIASANVSNPAPYDGESTTFTATLKPDATWVGWYSDAACTQLVSTSQTYTANAADLTLYAKATLPEVGTGTYLKVNGAFVEAKAVYRKSNGSWSEVDKSVFEAGKKYHVIT